MNNVFDGFCVDLSFIRKILKEIESKLKIKNNQSNNTFICSKLKSVSGSIKFL